MSFESFAAQEKMKEKSQYAPNKHVKPYHRISDTKTVDLTD